MRSIITIHSLIIRCLNRSFGIKKERLKLTDSEIINNFAPRKIVIITEQEHNRYPTDYQWVLKRYYS